MKVVLSILVSLGLWVACSSGNGNSGPVLPTVKMTSEEVVKSDDPRLLSLCISAEESKNKIDPRINTSLKYPGSLTMIVNSKEVSATGSGTMDMSVTEVTPDILKYRLETKGKLIASDGKTTDMNSSQDIKRECYGKDKNRTCVSTNTSGSTSSTSNDFFKYVKPVQISLGKVQIEGREYVAVRRTFSGLFPIDTSNGATKNVSVSMDTISAPELPSLNETNPKWDDCGQFVFMKADLLSPQENFEMRMALVLKGVQGELSKLEVLKPVPNKPIVEITPPSTSSKPAKPKGKKKATVKSPALKPTVTPPPPNETTSENASSNVEMTEQFFEWAKQNF